MNRNQQQSQMPVNQQQQNVPDHRLNELQERLRQLELQNTQLRTTVDYLKQGPQNGQAQPNQQPLFKPEVEEAIKQVVQQRIAPLETQYRQQIGYLADQLDDARFNQNYGSEKFKPYHQKVEQVRQQALAENRYISREDALRLVYFEETGKKNVEPQPQAQVQTQPKFDPYFGTMVDPQTGKPITQDTSGFAPQEMVDENGNPVQTHNMQAQPQNMQMQQVQQMQPQWQQAPTQQFQPQQQQQFAPGAQPPRQMSNHPNGNAYGQNFQLPNQGLNQAAAPAHQQMNGRQALSLDSTDADLQAFENNFGDIPL